MATWGAYFASYVKKTDASPALGAATGTNPSDAPIPVEKASTGPVAASTDSFKRSNSTIKKLYEIPTEFPKEIPQRSTSNAARVAKLFGYANSGAAKEKLGGVVEQAVAMEKTREEAKNSEVVSRLFANNGSPSKNGMEESQTSEIAIGLPPGLSSNATIASAEPTAGAKKDAILAYDGRETSNTGLKVDASPDLTVRMGGDTLVQPIPERAASTLLQSVGYGASPSPLAKVAKLGAAPLESMELKPTTRTKISKLDNNMQAMLDSFASQAPKILPTESVSMSMQSTAPVKKLELPKMADRKVKNDVQAMLDLFASQAQDLDSVEDMFSEASSSTKPKQDIKVKPALSSQRKESLGMLDFFASQAEVGSTGPELREPVAKMLDSVPVKTTESKRSQPTDIASQPGGAQMKLQPSSRRNKSLELLDFFASQAMSTISEDKPLSQQGNIKQVALATLPEEKPPPKKQEVFQSPVEAQIETAKVFPPNLTTASVPKIQEKAKTIEQAPVPSTTLKSPSKIFLSLRQRSEKVVVESNPRIDSLPRKRSATTGPEERTSADRRRSNRATSSLSSFEIQPDTDSKNVDEEESTIDFRESFLEYEKQAEQIRLEKEQMEQEHERMLLEMSMFQKEADRIAEEEAAMKKFVASLEAERTRDMENEDRKRKEREARLEAERLERERLENERLEQERLAREKEELLKFQAAEKERLAREKEELLQIQAAEKARLEQIEGDRLLAIAAEKERRERELEEENERAAMEEETRRKKEAEDTRRRKMEARLEEERLAREEVQRLNAEMLRYAEEAEADRILMEEELEREEAERLENERLDEEERLEQERAQYRQEQEEYERQREEEERFARQQRRKAREEAERLEYEREAAEEEERYAEQARRVEEEKRYAEQARREEIQRRKAEEARYAEQDRLAAGISRQAEMVEDDSDEEDEIVKAERKIKEAFAGLAKERGQAPPPTTAPMKRANTAQTNMLRRPDRGPMMRNQEADVRVARNNTVGARPPPPRKDQPMMRENTMRARPQIRGGLPSGPRRRE